jgi:HPt (histidine-containing phosphotransfer) domain-containing protein
MEDVFITKQVKTQYIERRKKDLDSLKRNLESKESAEFKRIGHQLKGNASTFGFLELEKIAKDLEKAGENKDWSEAQHQIELFEKWLSVETENLSKEH